MPMTPVPRIPQGSRPPERPESDVPTYVLLAATLACAMLGGVLGGMRGLVILGGGMLLVGGGLYALLARLLGWPRLRWDAIPWFIP
ncbi:MAG TPA: hypothetical protein VF641_02830 [Methylobacterium sp.]